MATKPKPATKPENKPMATKPNQAAAQAAEEAKLQAAQANEQDDNDSDSDSDNDEDASLAEGVTLQAGVWYPVSLTKAIRYQFKDASSAVRIKVGSYPAHLPLLPDWYQADQEGNAEPLAFSQDEKGAVVYQDKTAQAIYLTAQNAVKQAASLACKVIDTTTGKAPKAKVYKDEASLLAACKLVPPTDLAASWEDWLSTADRGGYILNCKDYIALLADIRKALAASKVSPAGVENTVRWFDLPGPLFSASDKARLVDTFVAYPTKGAMTDEQRKAAQDKVLARMTEQAANFAEAHPAGSAMLTGFLDSIRAKLAAPQTAVEDDTALD